jgi:Ser/Thr protein kinase RdoA (MazF antagonist)
LVIRHYLNTDTTLVERFPTGLANYVFDVQIADGRRVVVRFARNCEESAVERAVAWSALLRPLGVPLPMLLAHDATGEVAGFPMMLMERLSGTDLGDVYSELTLAEKRRLAEEIAHIQAQVGTLPPGPGYGYARSYHDWSLHGTWRNLLTATLNRCRDRISDAAVVSIEVVDRVERVLPAFSRYFDNVAPVAFLDDTTTKNVIVDRGRLSGIVDVDVVCFGDSLLPIGLTRMALLSQQYDTEYIDAWLAARSATSEQRAIVTLYTAIFCVEFLGEVGQHFNRDVPIAADPDQIRHLLATLDHLLAEINHTT